MGAGLRWRNETTGTAIGSTMGEEERPMTTFIPIETFPLEIPPPQKGTPSSTKTNLGPVSSKVIL
jgi:hypothetical protein